MWIMTAIKAAAEKHLRNVAKSTHGMERLKLINVHAKIHILRS